MTTSPRHSGSALAAALLLATAGLTMGGPGTALAQGSSDADADTSADTAHDAENESTPRSVWHHDIGLGYRQLASRTQALAERLKASCGEAGVDRPALRSEWLAAYQAWQAVRFVDFGPIEVDSRAWQLQFWPDAKNLVGTRVGARLRQDAPVGADDIAEAGVAEQGFPALEVLLYDDVMASRSLGDPLPCALAGAIGSHLVAVSDAVVADWQAFAPHYLATDSYNEATLHGAMQSLEILEDKRLGEPLGLMGAAPNAYRAEAWRSGQSVALAAASLAGLQQYFEPGLATWLDQAGHAELGDAFARQLEDTLDQAEAIDTGIVDALANHADGDSSSPAAQQELATLYLEVAQLRALLDDQIAPALGVVKGFNSSDGD
ncbi:imelysin family protein [Halomonas sp. RT37]|uniref:Imelysin family protein n=1 Tax=Halomonas sp. RT37 TaxID=2950872 RepID=A0AAU7KMT5_9GAMM